MKFAVLALAALAALGVAPPPVTDTFEVFKCSMTLPVLFQTANAQGHQVVVTKTLKTPDIVNLALGRALGTKLDPKTETLAFAGDASTPGAGSMVIVFNPTTKKITATVITTTNFVLMSNEDFSKNDAFANAPIAATTLGDPVHNGFHATTIALAGSGKNAGAFTSTCVAGPVSFTFTGSDNVTTTIDGLVIKGALKASGPELAVLIGS